MNDHKVWSIVEKKEVPENRTLVKNKWVFEIKRNGIFRARLVVCGYSQIPGMDFTESHSPVVHDATVRILLIVEMLHKLNSKLVDIETAFLHGEFKPGEEIYMMLPEGLKGAEKYCVKL